MPELPEVETVVRGIRPLLVGRSVQAVWCDREKQIKGMGISTFQDRILNQQFVDINRRAKYIVCDLTHDTLIIHLKMTGRLYVCQTADWNEADRWVHLKLDLSDGSQLRFSDSRRFGEIYLVADKSSVLDRLGVEPLSEAFSLPVFMEYLQQRQRIIKTLLMDQTFIAGVGNIYADESLFRARIHPLRTSNTLSEAEATALYHHIRAVLQEGIEREGASVNWYRTATGARGGMQHQLAVYNRTDQPCIVCGHPIKKITISQRGTHFCPQCQVHPTP
ncbi:MAG: DNA-formamidopyrimidine glycosylase [Phototrophicaceae bacterium]